MRNGLRMMLLLLLVACACTSTDAILLDTSKHRPALTPDKVIIYTSASQVPGKYEEVAILSATQEWGYSFADHRIYDSLRQKAAAIGANGVIIQEIEEPSSGAKIATMVTGVPSQRKGKAIAIFLTPSN